jgi:hypothetical protein
MILNRFCQLEANEAVHPVQKLFFSLWMNAQQIKWLIEGIAREDVPESEP